LEVGLALSFEPQSVSCEAATYVEWSVPCRLRYIDLNSNCKS